MDFILRTKGNKDLKQEEKINSVFKTKKSLEGGTSTSFFLRQLIPICPAFTGTLFKTYMGAKPDSMEA